MATINISNVSDSDCYNYHHIKPILYWHTKTHSTKGTIPVLATLFLLSYTKTHSTKSTTSTCYTLSSETLLAVSSVLFYYSVITYLPGENTGVHGMGN